MFYQTLKSFHYTHSTDAGTVFCMAKAFISMVYRDGGESGMWACGMGMGGWGNV